MKNFGQLLGVGYAFTHGNARGSQTVRANVNVTAAQRLQTVFFNIFYRHFVAVVGVTYVKGFGAVKKFRVGLFVGVFDVGTVTERVCVG